MVVHHDSTTISFLLEIKFRSPNQIFQCLLHYECDANETAWWATEKNWVCNVGLKITRQSLHFIHYVTLAYMSVHDWRIANNSRARKTQKNLMIARLNVTRLIKIVTHTNGLAPLVLFNFFSIFGWNLCLLGAVMPQKDGRFDGKRTKDKFVGHHFQRATGTIDQEAHFEGELDKNSQTTGIVNNLTRCGKCQMWGTTTKKSKKKQCLDNHQFH